MCVHNYLPASLFVYFACVKWNIWEADQMVSGEAENAGDQPFLFPSIDAFLIATEGNGSHYLVFMPNSQTQCFPLNQRHFRLTAAQVLVSASIK